MVNKRPGGNRLHLEAGFYRSPCHSQAFPAAHSHELAHAQVLLQLWVQPLPAWHLPCDSHGILRV